ncbi:CBS domain-containing protein [Cohnella herbarum]|uniref:CBS domain-containing protein n=1 Tax=Cohnella herbarum TaxID=2728023 RepID=A0A7Z2ZL43_9BACL|nr:CBS domain-containing protein [Cohnella herbarum]QJD82717.1 CBS domain-containing protein [Cohnella herbarum]
MTNIRDIMSKDLKTVDLSNNVFDVAMLMKNHDIGFVPVVDKGKLIGVVTDRDLVIRGFANKKTDVSTIEEVMTKGNRSISPDMSIEDAADQMAKQKVRRLTVVENGNLVGVVALADLAVRQISEDKAGQALSEISENVDHSVLQ